jgi:hypothetical protein
MLPTYAILQKNSHALFRILRTKRANQIDILGMIRASSKWSFLKINMPQFSLMITSLYTTQCYLFALATIVMYSIILMKSKPINLCPACQDCHLVITLECKFQKESSDFIQQFLNKIKIKQHDTCSYTPK